MSKIEYFLRTSSAGHLALGLMRLCVFMVLRLKLLYQTYVTFLNLILQEGGHPTSIVPVIITGLIHGPVWTLIVLEADCLCHQPGVPIIHRPRQDFTGVANCPRPARQVLYETILISYFTQFIYRVIKCIPSPGGIGLSLVLGLHRCRKLSTARKANTL